MRATISVVDTIVELPLPCGQFYGAPLFYKIRRIAPARLTSAGANRLEASVQGALREQLRRWCRVEPTPISANPQCCEILLASPVFDKRKFIVTRRDVNQLGVEDCRTTL
jgi:hypothetical protein